MPAIRSPPNTGRAELSDRDRMVMLVEIGVQGTLDELGTPLLQPVAEAQGGTAIVAVVCFDLPPDVVGEVC